MLKYTQKTLVLFKVLGICLVLLFIQRLVFLYLFMDHFREITTGEFVKAFLIGSLTDGVACIYFLLPMWLILLFFNIENRNVRRLSLVFFTVGFFVICLFNIADLGYYPVTKKRMGAEILNMLHEIPALLGAYLSDYWYLLILLFLFVLVALYIIHRQLRNYHSAILPIKYKALNVLVVLFCFFTIMRGGYSKRPFTPFDIPTYVNPRLQWLASNTSFNFLHTLQGETIPYQNYFSDQEAENNITYYKKSEKKNLDKKNILLIILESFSAERIGFYNPAVKAYTPFLDSLLNNSRTYLYGMANGKMTIDALPSVLSGIPSLMEKNYCYSSYSNNQVKGLAGLLRKYDYTTAFYYGGLKSTFGFENYIKLNFSDQYISQEDFISKYENSGWGVDDHLFLPFISSNLKTLKQPFCASLLTLSLHHPFPVPEPYQTQLDSIKDPVKKSMKYTDLSLQQFFNEIKTQVWYKNSVIAICADHTSEGLGNFEGNRLNEFAVPIVFFAPGDTSFNKIQQGTASQIDIYPTILDYIGYQERFGSMGSSLLHHSAPSIQYCGNGVYSIFEFPYLLEYDITKQHVIAKYIADTKRKLISAGNEKETMVELNKLEKTLKAYIQVFSNRINKNNL